ncbi:MAG: hypothetical protein DRJ42_14130 [Deltaproteobacteria bacterium]|nr:MAG: hypothetical protein DRJ42_14130 [Deltaproteobacteria bacterium]
MRIYLLVIISLLGLSGLAACSTSEPPATNGDKGLIDDISRADLGDFMAVSARDMPPTPSTTP